MSYGMAAALQAALYLRLSGLPALAEWPVLDASPRGKGEASFVLIGPEDVIDRSDQTGMGAEHRFTVSVISDAAGFQAAKAVAAVISDALGEGVLEMARGRMVGLWFQRAVARRLDEGRLRRIDLTFRARVEG